MIRDRIGPVPSLSFSIAADGADICIPKENEWQWEYLINLPFYSVPNCKCPCLSAPSIRDSAPLSRPRSPHYSVILITFAPKCDKILTGLSHKSDGFTISYEKH